MANFQFRLQTLLRLREADRQERRLELAQAYEAEQLLRTQIERLAAEERDMQGRCQVVAGPGRVNVDRLLDVHRYLLVLKGRSLLLHEKAARLSQEIERRRQALVEADRQVRMLEKLRERQLAQHRNEEERLETKRMDEVAQRRAGQMAS